MSFATKALEGKMEILLWVAFVVLVIFTLIKFGALTSAVRFVVALVMIVLIAAPAYLIGVSRGENSTRAFFKTSGKIKPGDFIRIEMKDKFPVAGRLLPEGIAGRLSGEFIVVDNGGEIVAVSRDEVLLVVKRY